MIGRMRDKTRILIPRALVARENSCRSNCVHAAPTVDVVPVYRTIRPAVATDRLH